MDNITMLLGPPESVVDPRNISADEPRRWLPMWFTKLETLILRLCTLSRISC